MRPILWRANDDANGPRWVDRLPVSPLHVLENYDLGANGVDQIETVVDAIFQESTQTRLLGMDPACKPTSIRSSQTSRSVDAAMTAS